MEGELALQIIEFVWIHRRTDTLHVLDPSSFPDLDPGPLTLEDSLRLRVGSAQAFCIVRTRTWDHFETVMDFLETTHSLLPRLVSPIKHMKIQFGLKTMIIMRMLKERRGLVDAMVKINQLFPSDLPQYQDQCSKHQMFLMKKNHLDFKAFVQVLVLQRDRLQDYVENHLEDQYGELYAQKVEERLLHYLLRLEAELQGDTCVDQILKRGGLMTEEERKLLKVVTSDSSIIVKTLNKLLHRGESSESETERSLNTRSASHGNNSNNSRSHPETDELKDGRLNENDPKKLTPQRERRGSRERSGKRSGERSCQRSGERSCERSGERSCERSGERSCQRSDERSCERSCQRSDERTSRRASSSPQFCSKHQRWVNSILQECPAECSEELQASSPPLFQSSSGSSSDDLTPSNLLLLSCTPPPPPPPPLPPPPHQQPVVRLIDISSQDQFYSILKHQHESQTAVHLQVQTGSDVTDQEIRDSTSSQSEASSPSWDGSMCRSGALRRSCRESKRSRSGWTSQGQEDVSEAPRRDASTSPPPPPPPAPPPPPPPPPAPASRLRLKLSLCSQALLLQSKLLQPCVSLTRCDGDIRRRSSTGDVEDGGSRDTEEEEDSSLDINKLYSSSSTSGSEDSFRSDPQYRPNIKRRRLLMEYEAARSWNNV